MTPRCSNTTRELRRFSLTFVLIFAALMAIRVSQRAIPEARYLSELDEEQSYPVIHLAATKGVEYDHGGRTISSPTPTTSPTGSPTTATPTINPTRSPASSPTYSPTARPTDSPTARPTRPPTSSPTKSPTARPTDSPTTRPTGSPTSSPPTQAPRPKCNQHVLPHRQQQMMANSTAAPLTINNSEVRKHAFIIPYRNRQYHYEQFVQFMNEYIPANFNLTTTQFSLWVIEQDDQEPFNRGWLANVGLAEIFRTEPDTQCITFHDIDLIPDTIQSVVKGPVFYDKCKLPTQIGSELSHFNWGVPYWNSAGGVTTLHARHWKQINGFSNDYVGWGGEDDDYWLRIKYNNLLDPETCNIHRPPTGCGRFRTISQKEEHHKRSQWQPSDQNYAVSLKILQQMSWQAEDGRETMGNQRWLYDGLSDLHYTVSSRQDRPNQANPGTGFAHQHHVKARQQLLEFVHIPKTAGSAIEKAAGKAGIPWGACHFHHALNKEMNCPDPPNFENLGLVSTLRSMRGVPSLWNVPPHYWNVNLMQSKRTFTVVRNPYDLALSIYYDKWVGYTGEDKEDPAALNAFLRRFYANPPSPVFKLPQGAYVYDTMTNNGRRRKMVDHVLKHENLATAFASLMEQYNLSTVVQLPETKFNQAPLKEGTKKLGRQNLTESTLQLIEKHYGQDFDLFNYTRMSQEASLGKPLAGSEQGPKAHHRRKFTKGIKPSNLRNGNNPITSPSAAPAASPGSSPVSAHYGRDFDYFNFERISDKKEILRQQTSASDIVAQKPKAMTDASHQYAEPAKQVVWLIQGKAIENRKWMRRLGNEPDTTLIYLSYDTECDGCMYKNSTTISSGRNLLLQHALQRATHHSRYYYYVLCDPDLEMTCSGDSEGNVDECWRSFNKHLHMPETKHPIIAPKTWWDPENEGIQYQSCVDGAIKAVRHDFLSLLWPHPTSADGVAENIIDHIWWHIIDRCYPNVYLTNSKWRVDNPDHRDYPSVYGENSWPMVLRILHEEFPNDKLPGEAWPSNPEGFKALYHRCSVTSFPPTPPEHWPMCKNFLDKRFKKWLAKSGEVNYH